jgi:chromosome segregation protein
MATETQSSAAAEKDTDAVKRAAEADARQTKQVAGTQAKQTKDAARKQAAQVEQAAKTDARLTEDAADAKARLTRQAADAYAAQTKDAAEAEARQIRHAAEVDARATVEAVAKDNVQVASELTRRVWERNIELAVSIVPAYLEAYERAAKSFSAVHRQTGRAAGQIGEGYTAAPRSVGESIPALFGAQADLIRETAEATASAARQRLTH